MLAHAVRCDGGEAMMNEIVLSESWNRSRALVFALNYPQLDESQTVESVI